MILHALSQLKEDYDYAYLGFRETNQLVFESHALLAELDKVYL